MRKYAFFHPTLSATGLAIVREIVEAPRTVDGITYQLHELYHASIVLTARQVSDDVEVGATLDLATGEYTNPEPVVATADGETGNGEPPRD